MKRCMISVIPEQYLLTLAWLISFVLKETCVLGASVGKLLSWKPEGVIIQQRPDTLKLAKRLHEKGIPGSSAPLSIAWTLRKTEAVQSISVERARYPVLQYGTAYTADEAIRVTNQVKLPYWWETSYVLGSKRMHIVINDDRSRKGGHQPF